MRVNAFLSNVVFVYAIHCHFLVDFILSYAAVLSCNDNYTVKYDACI